MKVPVHEGFGNGIDPINQRFGIFFELLAGYIRQAPFPKDLKFL
jgi:hypothetical protein